MKCILACMQQLTTQVSFAIGVVERLWIGDFQSTLSIIFIIVWAFWLQIAKIFAYVHMGVHDAKRHGVQYNQLLHSLQLLKSSVCTRVSVMKFNNPQSIAVDSMMKNYMLNRFTTCKHPTNAPIFNRNGSTHKEYCHIIYILNRQTFGASFIISFSKPCTMFPAVSITSVSLTAQHVQTGFQS